MPNANANINIRVDSDVKNKAQDVFSSLGLDMTSAINVFLRQAIRKNDSKAYPSLEAEDHDW